jgi:hypothetical protein
MGGEMMSTVLICVTLLVCTAMICLTLWAIASGR